MKYCINFYGKQINLLDEVDEINIDLSKIKDLNDLNDFCKIHKNQKINLCINDLEDAINREYFSFTFNFQKKYPEYNTSIRLSNWDDGICKKIKNEYPNAKIFFNTHIVDWDTLIKFLDYGVTDVYITEAMGFELNTIADLVHYHNAQIRVFPNVAQSSQKSAPDLMKFWIRPEDTEFYEEYIDVYEFFGDDNKQKIYYDIYKKDKKWTGNLKEIIIGLENDLDNTRISPLFAKKRVGCERRCLKGEKCQICHRIIELSETLGKTPLIITMNKEGGNK